jgi:TonB family protein
VKPGSEVFGFTNQNGVVGVEQKTGVIELLTIDRKQYFKLSSPEGELSVGSPILDELGEVVGIGSSRSDAGGIGHALAAAHLEELGVLPVKTDKPLTRSLTVDAAQGPVAGPSSTVQGGIPPGVPGGVVSEDEPYRPKDGMVIRKAGGVLQGSAIRRSQPLYPALAKAARISGSVVTEVVVDTEGDVKSARAVSGHPLLRDRAVAAARGWKFTPTLLGGAPVNVIGTVTFNFTL